MSKDERTHGYVIIDTETGDRWGQCYHSKSGATNSFNSAARSSYSTLAGLKFQTQNRYVLKELVVRDE